MNQPLEQISSEERDAVKRLRTRTKLRAPTPKLTITAKNDTVYIGNDHHDQGIGAALLMESIGTAETAFFEGLMAQLANAGTQAKQFDGKGPNFMLSVVKAISPRDELEAMLASQMAAVHMATMTFARRLAHVENIPQQDSAERAFNKLARTFALQLEALKKYRSNGEQKFIVQRVDIRDNGQAIVGNITPIEGGEANSKVQPHAK